MTPTGWQIREGRQMVGLSQNDLSAVAGVGLAVVVHAELVEHRQLLTRMVAAVQTALESAGVEFVQEEGGVGVQLRMAGA